MVEDSQGVPIALTLRSNLTILSLIITIIGGGLGIAISLWHFGNSTYDAIYAAGQAASERHREAVEFREYETTNDARVNALLERMSKMDEQILQAGGRPIPPPLPDIKAHHAARAKTPQ